MLKYKLDSLDGIDKGLQSLYEEKDGGYVLKVEGIDDGAELKRAKDHEKKARQQAEKERDELRQQFQAIEEERDNLLRGTIPKASAEQLENGYKSKISKLEKDYGEKIGTYQQQLQKLLIDQKAEAIARELAVPGSEAVLIPHIKSRLALDEQNFTTVYKNADGIDYSEKEMIEEFRGSAAFAPLLVASKATGGGASQSKGGGAAAKSIPRSQFDALGPNEKAAHIKSGGTVSE